MDRSVRGEKRKFDFRHRLASGEVRDVEVYSTPIYLQGRSFLYSIVHDVTDRKRMEEALLESKEKFRDIFNNANDAIHVHGFTESGVPGCFIDINEVACRTLGYTHEEMLQLQPSDISTDYHDLPMEKILENLRDNGSARFETEHRRKDGIIVPVEINARLVNQQGRKVTISVVRDITERKRVEEALQQASKKLNLLSSITRHDINYQIMVLLGNLELLEKKETETYTGVHLMQAKAAAERISTAIKFTKTYEDIGAHAPIWLEARTLVRTSARDIPLRHVKVTNDVPEGVEVFADPLIHKVFNNLIDNAVRHGGAITIRFSIEEVEGARAIVCEDDGIGISTEMKEKLFTRGFGKSHSLGLFLSREILSITGITIEEMGEPGKGVKFVMTVPQGGIRG
jgi:PAS domain S-box-containing protein